MLAAMRAMAGAPEVDPGQERRRIEDRLGRIKKLYEWGDKPEAEYVAERAQLQRQLQALAAATPEGEDLDALAQVLRDVRAAWEVADGPERNLLLRTLIDDLRIEGDRITAVKPRDAFAPFFRLNYEEWERENPPAEGPRGSQSGQERKRRGSVTRVRPDGRLTVELPDLRTRAAPMSGTSLRPRYSSPRSKISRERWPEVREHAQRHGLRATARTFGVSHEAVRQVVLRG